MTGTNEGLVPVVITTEWRGVFFGYAMPDSLEDQAMWLMRARNCIRWVNTRGFIGLASSGPNKDCRIGPAAGGYFRGVTSVLQCTPEAVAAWEEAPWG